MRWRAVLLRRFGYKRVGIPRRQEPGAGRFHSYEGATVSLLACRRLVRPVFEHILNPELLMGRLRNGCSSRIARSVTRTKVTTDQDRALTEDVRSVFSTMSDAFTTRPWLNQKERGFSLSPSKPHLRRVILVCKQFAKRGSELEKSLLSFPFLP